MLLLVLLLVGCTSTNSMNYSDGLQSWVGLSPEALMHVWGEPNNIEFVTPDEKIYTYIRSSNEPVGGVIQPYGDEVYYPAIDTPDFEPEQANNFYYCKTNFIIQDDVIVNFNYNGDDCVSTN